MFNPDAGIYRENLRMLMRAATLLQLDEVLEAPVHDEMAVAQQCKVLASKPPAGIVVLPDPFSGAHRQAIVSTINRYGIPAIYPFRYFPVIGGLVSYGPDTVDPFRHAASYVARILNGDKLGDLPVQQATKFELLINLKTAKALGLTAPPSLLARADEVIE
jgi:putative ABC transport system substrate-binding protein